MQKHRKKILGVVILVLVFAMFFGVRSIANSVRTANVSRTKTAAKTTDGATCGSDEEMNEHYGPQVSFDTTKHTVTITVKNGTFSITSVDQPNLLLDDPTKMGTVSPSKPMIINFSPSANGDVVLHFVLAETDDKCLAYSAASTNSSGQKVGTYEFDMTLQLKAQQATPQKENTNYNGICAVFRTGQGYDQYKDVLSDAGVSSNEIKQYNYSAVNESGKTLYNNLIPYCLSTNQVNFNYSEKQVASMINSAIEIWRKQASTGNSQTVSQDFKDAFEDAKKKALALGHDYSNLVKNGSIDDTRFGMTCDWKKEATGKTGDEYYVNKDYYYAKESETENIKYTYNYTSGKTQTVSGGSCTRECEESVVVEYGPPVASKAGLCFEYKIRVTSRVICESSLKLTPPTTPSICTPTPYCNQISGHVHQGGPNEDFEKCIQECDGGKYSNSCSNQCYKEVYGDDSESADPLAIRYGEGSYAQKMWSKSFPGYSGRYEWSNGRIVWKGSGYARWYKEFEDQRTRNDHGNYNVYDGFKKNDYGNGNHCEDNCYWSGCSQNSYLNEDDAADDTVNNLNIYNQAVSQCNAAATCTTKTAYFTISVDYTHDVDGKEKKETIEFPVDTSNNQASLPSHGSGQENTTPSGTDIFIPDTNEIGYAGCYESGDEKNWYQAEWSFPGTWINNKTGEISYEDKTGNNAWHVQKDKFCVPLDAKSVNTTWWQWSQVNKNCYTGDIGDTIDYNIHASTTDFGYFGWNFDFECFYALRNEVCDLDTKGCCSNPNGSDDSDGSGDSDTTISTRDYAFRIVDTTELFPKSETTTEDNRSTLSNTGRQPGYNWTLGMTDEDSSILTALNAKNPDYHIDPLSLINNIQKRGASIYNGSEYLDYQFVLDREALAEIRDFNDGKQYTEYGGNTKTKNGITVYTSDLWNVLGNDVVRKKGTPGVNNEGEGA